MKTKLINHVSHLFLTDSLTISDAKKRYRHRRETLAGSVLGTPLLLTAVDAPPGGNIHWGQVSAPLWQDPLFLSLTGILQEGLALFLYATSTTYTEILFVPKRDKKKEFWIGERFGIEKGSLDSDDSNTKITGIEQVLGINDLVDTVIEHIKHNSNTLMLYWNESEKGKRLKDYHLSFKRSIQSKIKKRNPDLSIANVFTTIWNIRPQIDQVDLANFKKAVEITKNSFLNFLPKLHSDKLLADFPSEQETASFLNCEINRRTPYGNSFPTICASGENATILHYTRNDSPLNKNKMILLDFGARYCGMNADVSRTIPTGKSFSLLQKIIYTIVLNANKLVEKRAKAGVTILELNEICWNYINHTLAEIFKNNETNNKSNSYKLFYEKQPHGVSHLIGIAVHDGDPFGEYKKRALRENEIISNEPGIYGEFSLFIDGKLERETIGVRIEDNLLITKTGNINLTKSIPKEIEELEAL